MAERSGRGGQGRRQLRTAALAILLVAGLAGVLYQPWLSQWGSTASEREGAVAGDGLIASPDATWTRSITIDAPPEDVWPWLVQIGVERGGFYNYDWGEQLFLDPIHNATRVHREWQRLGAGDVVHPKPGGDWRVVEVGPGRSLVLDNPLVTPTDWTWATELRPLGGDRTRVVTRIRSVKGTFFSYALDVPDLVLFPRLLTGLKQRAEGTLPGMAGTHTGSPFPLARLPVHWWAALAWVAGLSAVAWAGRRGLGYGRWRQPRPHPHLIFWSGFVLGAGYLLMSDTPPVQFLTHRWAGGLVVGVAGGLVLRRLVPGGPAAPRRRRALSRTLSSVVETGLFVLLPATAVWQAATALGWTVGTGGRLVAGTAAAAASAGVAATAWSAGRPSMPAVAWAAVLAWAYVLTGAGLAALVAVVLAEHLRPADVGAGPARPAPPMLAASMRRSP